MRTAATSVDSATGRRKTLDVTSRSPPIRLPSTRLRSLVGYRLPLATGIVAALIALMVLVGYLAHRTSSTHMASGTAYSTAYQVSVTTGGWSYDVPLQVPWRDSSGSWHDASRPACLPPTDRSMPVRFAWVPAHVAQVSWRAVVWVDCS